MADKPASAPDSGMNPILLIILILIGLFVFWMASGGPERARQEKVVQEEEVVADNGDNSGALWSPLIYRREMPSWGPSYGGGGWTGSYGHRTEEVAVNERGQKVTDSIWKGKVTLGHGNFSTSFTYDEYVTLSNSYNGQPVNITGWKLVSPKNSSRPAQYSTIPRGGSLLVKNPGPLEPIVLQAGERATIVSGLPFGSRPFKINNSFRVNKCMGYLARLDEYTFSPGFPSSCPRVQDGVDPYSINERCDNFLSSLGCGTLERGRDREGNSVWKAGDTILYTEGVSSKCLDIAKERASYEGCVVTHKNDEDFYRKEWMIFLDRRYELWPNRLGNVVLLDQYGSLVDQLVY